MEAWRTWRGTRGGGGHGGGHGGHQVTGEGHGVLGDTEDMGGTWRRGTPAPSLPPAPPILTPLRSFCPPPMPPSPPGTDDGTKGLKCFIALKMGGVCVPHGGEQKVLPHRTAGSPPRRGGPTPPPCARQCRPPGLVRGCGVRGGPGGVPHGHLVVGLLLHPACKGAGVGGGTRVRGTPHPPVVPPTPWGPPTLSWVSPSPMGVSPLPWVPLQPPWVLSMPLGCLLPPTSLGSPPNTPVGAPHPPGYPLTHSPPPGAPHSPGCRCLP